MNKIRPFSSGSQYSEWTASNCERCTKAYDRGEYCEIENALLIAFFDDGNVTQEIATRMGINSDSGYCWMCPEVEWTEIWKQEFNSNRAS